MLSAFCPVAVAASVTVSVKFEVPLAVGVPEIRPAALMLKPAGSDPVDTDSVRSPVPPAVATVAE